VNLADLPDAAPARLAPFLHVVRQGLGAWVVALVERGIRRQETAAAIPGLEASPALAQLLQRRRVELVQALTQALRAQLDAAPAPAPAAAPAGPAPRTLRLTLISETQIDDEIETARLVQLIESEAEIELQELASLCSRLHGSPRVDVATVPLNPPACARALREAVAVVAPDATARTALLRGLGGPLGGQMREVYAELVRWLQRQGVEPLGYHIERQAERHAERRPAPATARVAQLAAERLAGGQSPAPPAESMRELVAWAQRSGLAPLEAEPEALSLRLHPVPAEGPAAPRLPQAAAEDLMRRLFAELRRQTAGSPSMAGLLQRLERLAQRLAADDPLLWTDPAHPWWQLIDRLLAAAAVHDDLGPQDQAGFVRSLEALIQQLLHGPSLDAGACLRAAGQVQQLASQLLERATAPGADDVAELQREADREELELGFRNQIVQQLRSTPTSGPMRRFLVGPWTAVLTALALRHGAAGEPVAAAALVVDDLIRATAQPGRKVSRAQRAVLLRQVSEGLAAAELARPRIDAELVELSEILRNPPPHPADAAEAWREEPAEALPVPVVLDLHAGLPTVPLADGPRADGAAAPPTPAQWAAALQPGTLCRLFLQGIWMTARLNWVGPGQRLFLFESRHVGRSHTLTQRMLCRLREAGLATDIDDNLLRAQAMESLVRHTVI
jgi:hypothetical protein